MVSKERTTRAKGTKRLGSTETKGDKNEKRPRVLTGDQGLGEKGRPGGGRLTRSGAGGDQVQEKLRQGPRGD